MAVLHILKSGPFSTIQDKGRFGYQHLGVPISGALDREALQIGNALVGNHHNKSAIEICFGGFIARLQGAAVISLMGSMTARVTVTSNAATQSYKPGTAIALSDGDIIEINPFGDSLSCLLCLSGGIDVPEIYGSRATTTTAKLGGHEGRILAEGDVLALGPIDQKTKDLPFVAQDSLAKLMIKPDIVRIILGPQDFWFLPAALLHLSKAPYHITPQTSRMGMRLSGAKLPHKGPADIISDGMVRGAIQVPADGLPIIAMADHGTMGGYTKIACVISADIAAIGRLRPHDSFTFEVVTLQEAQIAQAAKTAQISAILASLTA